MTPSLGRRLTAEFVGTAFLLAAIIGSGIMAETLSPDSGLQLLQNAVATAGVLAALILTFGSTSGAHFNPVVSIAARALGELTTRQTAGYIVAQICGGGVGAIIANLMFELPAVNWSTTVRSGPHLWLAEMVATLGLLTVIFGTVRSAGPAMTALAVGGYIGGAYYFTSSTSFANPAVTIARTLTDTFTGIQPASTPGFLLAQLAGAVVAIPLIRLLFAKTDGGR